jgi:AraC-like DNA-binding protein
MSESTLRRHLALEGYNLSKIILDIRMNFGLMLLQTTQKRSYKLPKKWDMNQTLVLLFTLNNVLDLHHRGYVSQFSITNI